MVRNRGNDHLATLAELAASGTLGLTLRCGPCAHETTIPIADLVVRHGGASVAYEIAARHACSRCHGRPLTWWDRPETGGSPRAFKY